MVWSVFIDRAGEPLLFTLLADAVKLADVPMAT